MITLLSSLPSRRSCAFTVRQRTIAKTTVALFIEARRTANDEGDDFVFAYSTDGGLTYIEMVTVTGVADSVYQFNCRPALQGPSTCA